MTQASGMRLKEGAQINQSLSNLALVISKLVEMADSKDSKSCDFVPFRNSKLTHILQNSLSGNSKTVMMAAISPSADNWEETLSTLRFAESAKKIKTSASKNERSEENVIAALRRELEQLKAEQAKGTASLSRSSSKGELEALESAMETYGRGFEAQIQIARDHQAHCAKALEGMGLSLGDISETVGLNATTPQLVNCSHDPSLQGCLVYFLDAGQREIRVGSDKQRCSIILQGLGISECNCVITNEDDLSLTILPVEGRVLVNGQQVCKVGPLRHGDRLILGYSHCFRVTVPLAAEDVAAQEQEWANLDEALKKVKLG